MSKDGGKQPEFKRVNLSFDPEDWKMVSRYLERSEWRYLPKGTALRHILLQDVTARNSVLQGVPCPDPAPARVQIRTTTTPPEGDSKSADLDAFAALLRDLPWYGAKFNGGATPQSLAKTLVETYPKVDHCQAAREASAWLMANPSRRKTQLPRFLTGWFSRAGDPKPWAGQGKLDLTTEAGKEHARETESWSWEDYDKSNKGG